MTNVQAINGNLLITTTMQPGRMELSFLQRLDGIRRLETIVADPARVQDVRFSDLHLTGRELAREIKSYVTAYNQSIVHRLDRNILLPGDLIYDDNTEGTFVLYMLYGAKLRIKVYDVEAVGLQLDCAQPSADALMHCAEVMGHLVSRSRSPRDMN